MGQSASVSASSAVVQAVSSVPFEDEGDDEYEIDALVDASIERIHSMVCNPHAFAPHQPMPRMRLKDREGRDLQVFQLPPQAVVLNVYDLSDDLQGANDVLNFTFDDLRIGGAFHAGVEVLGSEWAYGFCGVVCMAPRIAADHVYRCGVYMGETPLNRGRLAAALQELCNTWRGADYDLLGKNCCSFSSILLEKLQVGPMPAWVDRLARMLLQGRSAGEGAVQAGRDAGQVLFGKLAKAASSELERAGRGPVTRHGGPVSGLKDDGVNWDLWEGAILEYPVGAAVEYKSSSQGIWINAKVLKANKETGTYDLDCKPQVQAASIRWPGGKRPLVVEQTRPYAIGAAVEYNSTSQRKWVPAKVVSFDESTGLYNLDCKQQVPLERIRPRRS